MATVTIEALNMVSKALFEFRSEIGGMARKADNHADEIIDSSKTKLSKAENDVKESENKISEIKHQINDIETEISRLSLEIHACETKIPELESQIRMLESQIAIAENEIMSLMAEALGEESGNAEAKISSLENSIARWSDEISSKQQELEETKVKLTEYQFSQNEAKSNKDKKERELSAEKNRCMDLKNKHDRMKVSFMKVESGVRNYASAAKRFEWDSTSAASKNETALDICISSIDNYLSVSL